MTVPSIDVPRVPDGVRQSQRPKEKNLFEKEEEKAHTRGCLLPRFRSMRGEVARWNTETRLAWDDGFLHVEFACEDQDAWGTMTERDAPLWQEEVVEIFLAAGDSVPLVYYEIEVSPLCALFDARVTNPRGDRADMRVETDWDCDGIEWSVERTGERDDWRARISIPWRGIELSRAPRSLRANFFRIERPRRSSDGGDEYSGWSPTDTDPPDFHRPEKFGLLRLVDFV